MNKIIAIAVFLVSTSLMAGSRIYVGNLTVQQVQGVHVDATRLGMNWGTQHQFGNDVVLKYSVTNTDLARRAISVLSKKYPRQLFELDGGRLQRRIASAPMTSAGFQMLSQESGLLVVSHAAPLTGHGFFMLFPSSERTSAFLRSVRKPSSEEKGRAEASRRQFETTLAAYPDGEVPQALIHCSPLGICWCEGYGSCNNLIAACVQANAEWNCSDYDDQGGCTSGACAK